MTNQKRLEEYLVGDKEKNELGYLKSDISNGKVIMLSGKWGSGKTHFWKNKIEEDLKKEKIPNNYISLYGKTSIEEIKNEVFLKIFESMDIFKIDDKSVNLAKNTANLIADFTKTVSVFGVNLDLSKIVDKSFEKLDEVREKQKEEKTKALLNSGAIICFDDFERKSKDIDLNDLFGFITQLTLNFSCKVVIILNDDVFEGEEKKIFSNVKEKSVSKFLRYEPSIKELFETIFSDDRYRTLDDYKEIILNTIEETGELNARIYIQVLDNLVEWFIKTKIVNENFIKYFIFANINYILNHYIFNLKLFELPDRRNNWIKFFILDDDLEERGLLDYIQISRKYQNINYIEGLKSIITNKIIVGNSEVDKTTLLEYVDENQALVRSLYNIYGFNINKLAESNNQFEYDIFNKINNFIETGILINE